MKTLIVSALLVTTTFILSGCGTGTGKEIAKGAVRGASHGAIDKNIPDPVGQGAAHGALGAAQSERDKNKARRE